MSTTSPLIQIVLGDTLIEFAGDKVREANLVLESDPISQKVPASSLTFRVIDADGSLSMFAGETFEQLKERLPVMAYEYVDGVSEFVGKFYLETWGAVSEQEFEFVSGDLIAVLVNTEFEGIFWPSPIPFSLAMAQIFNPIGAPFVLDPALASKPVSGWIAPGNYRDALRQLCLSAGASVSTARSTTLVLSPVRLPTLYRDVVVQRGEKLQAGGRPEVSTQPAITDYEVIAHTYTQGEELQTIYEEYLEVGFHKIIFDQPYFNITVNGPGFQPSVLATEDGRFVVTEDEANYIAMNGEYVFGPNSVELNVASPGLVTITGYQWIDSQRAFAFQESGTFTTRNPISLAHATLINPSNAQALLDLLVQYYRLRYTHQYSLLPRLVSPGDRVIAPAYGDVRLLSVAERVEMSMTRGYLPKISARGHEPAYIPPADDPSRRPRCGVAEAGQDMTRQNMFREYA